MTAPTTKPVHRFAQLDSIRAVAAIMVVATHTSFWAGVYTRGTWGAATQRLEVGVAIFFVLSGFLLSRPYLLRARHGTSIDRTCTPAPATAAGFTEHDCTGA